MFVSTPSRCLPSTFLPSYIPVFSAHKKHFELQFLYEKCYINKVVLTYCLGSVLLVCQPYNTSMFFSTSFSLFCLLVPPVLTSCVPWLWVCLLPCTWMTVDDKPSLPWIFFVWPPCTFNRPQTQNHCVVCDSMCGVIITVVVSCWTGLQTWTTISLQWRPKENTPCVIMQSDAHWWGWD